jgi:hypothetical protein
VHCLPIGCTRLFCVACLEHVIGRSTTVQLPCHTQLFPWHFVVNIENLHSNDMPRPGSLHLQGCVITTMVVCMMAKHSASLLHRHYKATTHALEYLLLYVKTLKQARPHVYKSGSRQTFQYDVCSCKAQLFITRW